MNNPRRYQHLSLCTFLSLLWLRLRRSIARLRAAEAL